MESRSPGKRPIEDHPWKYKVDTSPGGGALFRSNGDIYQYYDVITGAWKEDLMVFGAFEGLSSLGDDFEDIDEAKVQAQIDKITAKWDKVKGTTSPPAGSTQKKK